MKGLRLSLFSVLWCLLLSAAAPAGLRAQTNAKANANTNAEAAFFNAVAAGFSSWDSNHNHVLSVEELDAAIEDAANQGPAAAALAALKRASRSTNYTLPPLTLDNIRQLAGNPPATNRPNFASMFRAGLKRLRGATNRDLFASGLPQLSTIRQGRMGDCFCLAPLGAMIHRDPREVASLFSTREDGSVRVEFGGGAVAVPPPTDAELAITAGNSQDGVWVNLYEKAIAQARNDLRAPEKRAGLAIDAIATGGSEAKILSYLTGHRVTRFGFGFAKNPALSADALATNMARLRMKLTEATRQNLLMACGTQKPTTPGLTPKHAFALLSYDPQAETVALWNPHGNGYTPKGPPGPSNGFTMKNGLLTVPLTDFVKQFTGMSFESTFSDLSSESAEPPAAAAGLKVGDPAPAFKTGKWIQGQPIRKFSPGKAYLVEFWATWCEPCRNAIPYLNQIQNRYQDRGLTVVGLDCWEHDAKAVAPFVKAMGNKMSYPLALIGKDRAARNWLAASGRDAIPTAFLVDTQGRIAWIGHPLGLKEALVDEVLAGTFDSQKAATQYAREQEARKLFKQASGLMDKGKLAEAEAPLNRLLKETNEDAGQTAQFLAMRGESRARRASWQQAADDFAQVVEIDPSEQWTWRFLASVQIESGKTADYPTYCKEMLDRFGDTTAPRVAEGIAKTCLLLPSALSPDDLTRAGQLAEKAVTLSGKRDWMHWRLMTRGLAEYRQGRFTDAIETMRLARKALAHERDGAGNDCEAVTEFVTAMAQRQLNQSDKARAALDSGLEIVRAKLPKLDGQDLGEPWYDVLPAYILMREAKETVEGASAREQTAGGAEKL